MFGRKGIRAQVEPVPELVGLRPFHHQIRQTVPVDVLKPGFFNLPVGAAGQCGAGNRRHDGAVKMPVTHAGAVDDLCRADPDHITHAVAVQVRKMHAGIREPDHLSHVRGPGGPDFPAVLALLEVEPDGVAGIRAPDHVHALVKVLVRGFHVIIGKGRGRSRVLDAHASSPTPRTVTLVQVVVHFLRVGRVNQV